MNNEIRSARLKGMTVVIRLLNPSQECKQKLLSNAKTISNESFTVTTEMKDKYELMELTFHETGSATSMLQIVTNMLYNSVSR